MRYNWVPTVTVSFCGALALVLAELWHILPILYPLRQTYIHADKYTNTNANTNANTYINWCIQIGKFSINL